MMNTIEDRLHRYRAKRLRFLINGDKFYTGINYALNTEKTRSYDALLNELTISLMENIKLCKGVRYIFAQDGSIVRSLGDFQDGNTYICSSTDNFIVTDYRDKDGVLNWLVRNSACISSNGIVVKGVKQRQHQQQQLQVQNHNNGVNHNSSNVNLNATNHHDTESSGESKYLTTSATKLRTSHNNINNISQQNNNNNNNHNNDQITSTMTTATTTSKKFNDSNNHSNNLKPNSASTPTTRRLQPAPRKVNAESNLSHNNNNNSSNLRTSNTPTTKLIRPSTPVNNSESARKRIGAGSQSPQPRPKLVDNKDRKSSAQNQKTSTSSATKTTKSSPKTNDPRTTRIPPTAIAKESNPSTKTEVLAPATPTKTNHHEMQPTNSSILFGSEVTEKYDIGRPIGDGHFSVVYFCMNKTTQEFCALKLIDKLKCKGKDDMIYNEVSILKELNHPNIVKLIEEFDYSEQLYLILELVQDGDLFDAISTVTRFSEVHVATMIHNLSSALTYLHKQGIVHRDIKPENLLISVQDDGSQSLKLADFGLAIQVGDNPLYSVCGTAFYVSPEMLNETGYDYKVDVWSTGVICFILLCGYPPFTSENESNQDELFDAILAGDLQFAPEYWSKISQHAKNLIKCMLTVDPEKRFTAEQVFTNPWTMGTSSNFDGIEPMNISRKIALQSL